MIPYAHQTEIAYKGLNILQEHKLLYLAMEERTGKTLTSIVIANMYLKENEEVLILTKKRALSGWEVTLQSLTHPYTLINYESAHKLSKKKTFKLVILDEAHHALGSFPKPSKTWRLVKPFCKEASIIYLSATPSAQTYAQLFHQFYLSSYSPWSSYKSFYEWFRAFGIPVKVFIGGRMINQYHRTDEDAVWQGIKHLFISYTRKELGYLHEPFDELHFVVMKDETKKLIEQAKKEKMLPQYELLLDTPSKELSVVHQIEGGTIKLSDDNHIELTTLEKIRYMQEHWSDSPHLGIFHHFKAEEHLLRKYYPSSVIMQGDAFAEGVDLSNLDTLIVYSMGYSVSKYVQRRARQCHPERAEPITVHYILMKNGVSSQVYQTVAVKRENYVTSYYLKEADNDNR